MNTLNYLRENMGDESELREVINLYLEDVPNDISKLRSAISSGDPFSIRHVAHTLKSTCANFGVEPMVELCQEMENLGKNGIIDGAEEKLIQIERQYGRASKVLREFAVKL